MRRCIYCGKIIWPWQYEHPQGGHFMCADKAIGDKLKAMLDELEAEYEDMDHLIVKPGPDLTHMRIHRLEILEHLREMQERRGPE